MKSFTFNTTKSLICQTGAARSIGEILVKGRHGKRVFVVTDPFLHESKIVSPAIMALDQAGLQPAVFTKVVADPPEDVVLEAVAAARDADVDCVVGIGGGSSLDVAKLVAYLAHPRASEALGDIYGVGMCTGARLPLVQVPTTAGTGSEATPISIITTGAQEKKGVVSPQLYADLAILDGDLTVTVPPPVTAATGIDAMVHAVEAFTCATAKNPLSDVLALEAIGILASNLPRVMQNPSDRQSRTAMLLGSYYAGMAFANAPVAAVHALAYPVGSLFKVPHGLSNSLMLPHVLRFNSEVPAAKAQYDSLLEKARKEAPDSVFGRNDTLAGAFADLAVECGIPLKLSDVGIGPADLDALVADAMKQTRLLPNNPRPVTADAARALYAQALEGV